MDHVIDALAGDPELARRIEGCKWMQSLSFPLLREDDPDSAEKALTILRQVAERGARGDLVCTVEGKIVDGPSQQQFRESMHDLVIVLGAET